MSLIFNFYSTSNVLFYIQLITWYSTMYLTSNCLFNIQLFIQHSNIHLAFNYSFNIQLFIQSISVEPSLFLFSGLISKQKLILQGHPLDVLSTEEALDSETNFVCIDRFNVFSSAAEEFHYIQNLSLTLEVSFYGEKA